MILDAWGCCRDDPEGWYWEGEGGGVRMGNTCIPMVDSCWCIAKPIQYYKVINLLLNKFIFKKKARDLWKSIYFCFIDYAKAFGYVDQNKLWKIQKEMGTPDHSSCLLRNLYAGQEAAFRTGHGKTDWFQIRKGVCQAVYCHPTYLTYMQSTSWETLGWMKHKLESRLLGEISIPQICRWHHPYGRKWRGTKKPLDESERGEWKCWLKAQHSEN